MVLFGDPQTYSKFTFSQPIFELMTAWTAAHKDLLNIKLALCKLDGLPIAFDEEVFDI